MGASNGPWGCSWYAKSGLYIFLNRSGRCAAACDADILWSQKDKRLTEAWMAVFATVCLISVAIAILTLLKPRKQPILTTTAGEDCFTRVENIFMQNDINTWFCIMILGSWILRSCEIFAFQISSNIITWFSITIRSSAHSVISNVTEYNLSKIWTT